MSFPLFPLPLWPGICPLCHLALSVSLSFSRIPPYTPVVPLHHSPSSSMGGCSIGTVLKTVDPLTFILVSENLCANCDGASVHHLVRNLFIVLHLETPLLGTCTFFPPCVILTEPPSHTSVSLVIQIFWVGKFGAKLMPFAALALARSLASAPCIPGLTPCIPQMSSNRVGS